MIERVYQYSRTGGPVVGKIVDDERAGIDHIVVAPGVALPKAKAL